MNQRESTALRLLDLGGEDLITSDPVLVREVADWYAGPRDTQRMPLRLRRWMLPMGLARGCRPPAASATSPRQSRRERPKGCFKPTRVAKWESGRFDATANRLTTDSGNSP